MLANKAARRRVRVKAPRPLSRGFFDRPVADVARGLLGKRLVRLVDGAPLAGRIVETEAYLAKGDTASHSHRGPNRRNAAMFGPPGHAYVYVIHARHCLNVVTEAPGVASAVLIRAVEPLLGQAVMARNRGTDVLRDLARGPARLCEAFDVDRAWNGWDLTRGESLWIDDDNAPSAVPSAVSMRIGVTSAHDLPLRFFIPGSPFVSGPRRFSAAVCASQREV